MENAGGLGLPPPKGWEPQIYGASFPRTVHCLAANTQRMMQNSLSTLTQNFKVAPYREVDRQQLERASQETTHIRDHTSASPNAWSLSWSSS